MSGAWRGSAACAGHNPEWWADDWSMRPTAVQICLGCPVREACLADALRWGDFGVVRGAMLLVEVNRRGRPVSLVCAHCGTRPVRATPTGYARYCGPGCQSAASYRRARAAAAA